MELFEVALKAREYLTATWCGEAKGKKKWKVCGPSEFIMVDKQYMYRAIVQMLDSDRVMFKGYEIDKKTVKRIEWVARYIEIM